jgi:hypothetical protein
VQELQLELPALDADDQEPFDSDEELEEIGAGSGELADVIRCSFMRAVAEHSKSGTRTVDHLRMSNSNSMWCLEMS